MVAHSQNTKQGDIILSLTVAFMQGGQPIVFIVSIDMKAGKSYIIISDFLVIVMEYIGYSDGIYLNEASTISIVTRV